MVRRARVTKPSKLFPMEKQDDVGDGYNEAYKKGVRCMHEREKPLTLYQDNAKFTGDREEIGSLSKSTVENSTVALLVKSQNVGCKRKDRAFKQCKEILTRFLVELVLSLSAQSSERRHQS